MDHAALIIPNVTIADHSKIWTATSRGEYIYFSKRYYEYTGLSPEDCLGFVSFPVLLHLFGFFSNFFFLKTSQKGYHPVRQSMPRLCQAYL